MLAHIVVNGRVQGVGFRYSTQQHAKKHNLTGWVQNKSDGTVELEVEGLENDFDAFITELKQGFNRFITVDDVAIEIMPTQQNYEHFSIK